MLLGGLACVASVAIPVSWGSSAGAQPVASPPALDRATEDIVQRWTLSHPLVRVIDGDTIDVDLNGNGLLDDPGERLRLLYIDTPEIEDNPKGRDLAHGLPAKAALEKLVAADTLDVQVIRGNEQDRYGRTLALLRCGSVDVNLELVRLGHSPLDTRFSYPADYPAFIRAEAEAFSARRGIWADEDSRRRYLTRLKKDGRTPQALDNMLWVTGVQTVDTLNPVDAQGRYVIVDGVVRERRPMRKGVWQLTLGDADRISSSRTLTVVAFPRIADGFEVERWPVSARVRVEGFLNKYRGKFELQMQYAGVSP